MFESLTHWFESLENQSKLFTDPDDEALHAALASVLYHIVSADGRVPGREKHEFAAILKQEFDLEDEQIEHLYLAAKSSTSDLQADLQTVSDFLKPNPAVRMSFMSKLNHLIDIDGVKERELDLFYEALHFIFPDIKTS
ncbi:MAG: putative tellurite resistance protein B-like protein [Gammaproteobacteria bacterium]|jgi:uncharacterized tellurite resistance protein B-like protein